MGVTRKNFRHTLINKELKNDKCQSAAGRV